MPFIGTRTADNKQADWRPAEPLDPAAWIPLTELALEGFGHSDTIDGRAHNLRHDLAAEILLDDIGRACVPRGVAREMFAERNQKQRDEQVRASAARAEAVANDPTKQLRARVRALQARETTGDPLADMKREDIEADWERAAQRRDEVISGQLVYHPVRQERT